MVSPPVSFPSGGEMTTFVAFTALDGTSVRAAPVSVAFVTVVPSSLLPAGVAAGAYLRTLGDDVVAVQGELGAVQAALEATEEAAFAALVPLTDPDNDALANPALVSHLEPVPANLLPAGVLAATYVRSGARNVQLVVEGTVADVESELEAVAPPTPADDLVAFARVSNNGEGASWLGNPVGFDGNPTRTAAGIVVMTLSEPPLSDTDYVVHVTPLNTGFSVTPSYDALGSTVTAVLRTGATGFDGVFSVLVTRRPVP